MLCWFSVWWMYCCIGCCANLDTFISDLVFIELSLIINSIFILRWKNIHRKKRLFILFLCSNTKIYMKKKVYFIFVFQHKNLHAWKMFILYLCFNTNNNIQKKCLNIKVYKKKCLFIYILAHTFTQEYELFLFLS